MIERIAGASTLAFLLILVGWIPAQSQAQAKRSAPCDLALVLAVDLSASVNMYEYRLQHGGIAAAFRHPLVIDAILSTGSGGIWVTLVHWSGVSEQTQSVGWTQIRDETSAFAFAATVDALARPYNTSEEGIGTGTALGGALHFIAPLFRAPGPSRCNRRVVDVSGDGRSNVGPKIRPSRNALLAEGLTINGLAILSDEPDLGEYYQHNLIGGPAAFVMTAFHESFAVAPQQALSRNCLQTRLSIPFVAQPPIRQSQCHR